MALFVDGSRRPARFARADNTNRQEDGSREREEEKLETHKEVATIPGQADMYLRAV